MLYEKVQSKCFSRSVVSDSLRPHGLLHPWDFPGKSPGVGCHFLLQGIFPTQGSTKKQQHYCWVMAVSVGSTTSGENIACLLLWLLHRPGEDKLVCSSYGSSSFLPASLLAPCLPWVQRTVYTVRHRKTTGVTYRISNSAYTGNKKSEKE